MTLSDKIVAAIEGEAEATAEALELLKAVYGETLAFDAAQMLKGWTRLHSNIGMVLVVAKLAGARQEDLERLAEALYGATVDVMTHHVVLIMQHSNIEEAKRDEVIRYIMRYLNRTSAAVIATVHREFNCG